MTSDIKRESGLSLLEYFLLCKHSCMGQILYDILVISSLFLIHSAQIIFDDSRHDEHISCESLNLKTSFEQETSPPNAFLQPQIYHSKIIDSQSTRVIHLPSERYKDKLLARRKLLPILILILHYPISMRFFSLRAIVFCLKSLLRSRKDMGKKRSFCTEK